jgi:hypothetical protein
MIRDVGLTRWYFAVAVAELPMTIGDKPVGHKPVGYCIRRQTTLMFAILTLYTLNMLLNFQLDRPVQLGAKLVSSLPKLF